MTEVMLTVTVLTPPVPDHLTLSDGGEVPLSALPDSELRKVGQAYMEGVLELASQQRRCIRESEAADADD